AQVRAVTENKTRQTRTFGYATQRPRSGTRCGLSESEPLRPRVSQICRRKPVAISKAEMKFSEALASALVTRTFDGTKALVLRISRPLPFLRSSPGRIPACILGDE